MFEKLPWLFLRLTRPSQVRGCDFTQVSKEKFIVFINPPPCPREMNIWGHVYFACEQSARLIHHLVIGKFPIAESSRVIPAASELGGKENFSPSLGRVWTSDFAVKLLGSVMNALGGLDRLRSITRHFRIRWRVFSYFRVKHSINIHLRSKSYFSIPKMSHFDHVSFGEHFEPPHGKRI